MPIRSLLFFVLATTVGSGIAGCGGSTSPISATTTTSAARRELSPPQPHVSWLQPGLNSEHAADNATEKALKPGTISNLKMAWSFATGGTISEPVLTDGTLAIANSSDGYLYAIDVRSGTQKWSFQTNASPNNGLTAAAVAGDLVYTGCNINDNNEQEGLCAVNEATGVLLWSWYYDCTCKHAAFIATGPVVSGSTVLFGYFTGGASGKKTVTALNAATGELLWQTTAGSGSASGGLANSIAAIDNGNVYVGTDKGLCSLQLGSGVENWCNGPNDLGIAPAVANGVVFINTLHNGFYALNEATGNKIWQYTPATGYSGPWNPPAVDGATVYFTTTQTNGTLYALNAADGSPIFASGGSGSGADALSSPSVANRIVYVTCGAGICAYDATTGALLVAQGRNGSANSPPAIAYGRIYNGCGASSGNSVCMYDL
ncbi:MAG: PQQ-binding-like beta-propeller repeat protein [Candidatus Eremiobacteraeota bacterium]|nr:PQQ-binding-like beta-propeller repeat protein [Candidatus Eremiobacteraeota bacterium]